MNIKHTPGPWQLCHDDEYHRICIDGPSTYPIAQMPEKDTAPNLEANALLIRASPEMFNALRAVQTLVNSSSFHDEKARLRVWELVDAAVQRAKGGYK